MDNVEAKEDSLEKNIKRILIDITFLFDQYSKRGMGRYGKDLLTRLIKIALEDSSVEIAFVGFLDITQNLIHFGFDEATISSFEPRLKFFSLGKPVSSGIKNPRLWRRQYVKIINKYMPSVFFSPNFERGLPTTPGINKQLKHKPKTIVTVYDVIPIATNKYTSKTIVHNLIKKRFYNKMFEGVVNADVVLTISQFSKDDIIKHTDVDPDKIKVIYLGVSEQFYRKSMSMDIEKQNEILNNFGISRGEYFFYDSGLEPNKGINDLLLIFKRILQLKSPRVPSELVVVGGGLTEGSGEQIEGKNDLGRKFVSRARELGVLENITATDRISDDVLRVLLFNSRAYLYLSKYEGFGFGPVQAMAAEIPSVVHNGSCLPEVTNGGSLLINSSESEAAARQIESFLGNSEIVERYIDRGLEVAKKYNWEDTARFTWIEIQRLLSN